MGGSIACAQCASAAGLGVCMPGGVCLCRGRGRGGDRGRGRGVCLCMHAAACASGLACLMAARRAAQRVQLWLLEDCHRANSGDLGGVQARRAACRGPVPGPAARAAAGDTPVIMPSDSSALVLECLAAVGNCGRIRSMKEGKPPVSGGSAGGDAGVCIADAGGGESRQQPGGRRRAGASLPRHLLRRR